MGMKAPTAPPYKRGDKVVRAAPPPPQPKPYATGSRTPTPTPNPDPTTAHCHCHDVILPGDEVTYLVRFKKI